MNYLKFLLIALIGLFLVACWSAEEKKPDSANMNTNLSNTEGTKNESQNEQAEGSANNDSTKPVAETKPDSELTPTEALRAFDQATLAQDAEKIKRFMTKSSLEYFEQEAKKQGMTFKQLVERPNEMPTVQTPEMRNEKIDGKTATVEAKNRATGSFDEYPLIKEGGVWKVAFDKYLKQKLEEINKIQRQIPKPN